MSRRHQREDQDEERGEARKLLYAGIGLVSLLVIGAVVGYILFAGDKTTERKAVTTTMVEMLPPPPPPPPPPEEPPPEPEPEEQEETPQETPTPEPTPTAPVTMDADAQAGGDAFGIQAGKGGGMGAPSGTGTGTGPVGGGVTERFYNRYLSQTLEQSIRQKDGVNRRVFTAQVDIWISGSGSVTKAALAKSTGDKALDANLVAALEEINGLSQPPATLRFPQRIRVRGSRGT